jgi:hypothetical protein
MPETSTLQTCIIALHFEQPLGLSLLDVADWVNANREVYPTAQQSASTPRVDMMANPQLPAFSFVDGNDLPRMTLSTRTNDFSIILQTDRVAFSWNRVKPVGEMDSYVGFLSMKARWKEFILSFQSWHSSRLGGKYSPRLLELGYNNAVSMDLETRRRRIGEVFNWVNPGRGVNAFQVAWGELIRDPDDDREFVDASVPRVNANVALGVIPPAQRVLVFNFVGLGQLVGDDNGVEDGGMVDTLHSRILDIYAETITSPDRDTGEK